MYPQTVHYVLPLVKGGYLPSEGDTVRLIEAGRPYRTGIVEAVMPDGSGFWLSADGAYTRIFIPLHGHQTHVTSTPPNNASFH